MVKAVISYITERKPPCFVLENVAGLLQFKHKRFFNNEILKPLLAVKQPDGGL